jgi:hypothetical protein
VGSRGSAICPHGPAAHQLNMKPMWDRRCRLSIGTKGGKVLLGLDLRSLRLDPAPTFFKGTRLKEGSRNHGAGTAEPS